MENKIMVVPGKIARVEVAEGSTVLDICRQAEIQVPGVGWETLAKEREVRVQNRIFSNTAEVSEDTFGSISTTALSDGDVILILTKIKGNGAVITCWIDGEQFALETPVEAKIVLAEVAGVNLANVEFIYINGEEAEETRLVGEGDDINVVYRRSVIDAEDESDDDLFAPIRDYIADLENQVMVLHDQLNELEDAEPFVPIPIAIFGHLGDQLMAVELESGQTVQDLCDEHGDLDKFEIVLYNGHPLNEEDLDEVYVQAGDSVLIVPTTKNGLRVKFLIEE